jgi:hypothetical protein
LNQNQYDSVFQVAITSFEQYKFYFLPPKASGDLSSVNVAYQTGSTCTVDARPRDCESGLPSTVHCFHSLFYN